MRLAAAMPARSAKRSRPKRPIIFAASRGPGSPAPLPSSARPGSGSEILRDRFEFADRRARGDALTVAGHCQAVVDMIVDQRLFRLADRFLDGVKLLCEIKAGAPLFDHRDHPPQMTFGAPEPLDDIRM